MKDCHLCGAPVYALDRCRTCYEYRRRTGKERPQSLIVRAGLRFEERPELLAAARIFYRETLENAV